MSFLYVFLGGGLGSLLRYLITTLFFQGQGFYQALIPNLLGCFLIGFFSHLSFIENESLKLLFIIGFLGGFTTFSSYMSFIGQAGFTNTAVSYFLLNNTLGLLFYFIGVELTRQSGILR